MMIVTDKGLTGLNLLDGLYEGLKADGIDYVVYDKTQPNPSIDNIEEVRKLYLDNGCQGFIAFGGGSPMDCAKGAAARVVCPNKTVQKMRGQLKIRKKLPPFFAVPTTAGTGSETTLAAVVTDTKTHEKYALNDPVLRPKYAVLDPELTVGLPPHITSTTGMDALTHAVEAYIGHSNTKDTSEKAEVATKLIFENLEEAYKNGKDLHAREQMLLASHYAGIAFTRAYVGNVHAIAHNLGGFYGVPHGLANAIILPMSSTSTARPPMSALQDSASAQALRKPVRPTSRRLSTSSSYQRHERQNEHSRQDRENSGEGHRDHRKARMQRGKSPLPRAENHGSRRLHSDNPSPHAVTEQHNEPKKIFRLVFYAIYI